MKYGLKRVAHRRHDDLSRVRWDRLEHLLAEHYRTQGYDVEHVGTAGRGARFDGGIDLKLRRGGDYVLVQVKHWNACKVPHNEVHQLIGVMVNEGATGAILATSGEFTKAAIEAGARHGRVELIDGHELRARLGPLPADTDPSFPGHHADGTTPASRIGGRMVRATIDHVLPMAGRHIAKSVGVTLGMWMAKAIFALLVFGFLLFLVFRLLPAVTTALQPVTAPSPATDGVQPARARPEIPAVAPAAVPATNCHEPIDKASGTDVDHCNRRPSATMTEAQSREAQRKADEAIEILRHSTPEM